jgi:hypothetical protein
MDPKYILRWLAELRLNHLPTVILNWIFQDLEGLDEASVQAILTLDYAVMATRCAIDELVRRRPAARQKWVAVNGSGRVLETIKITRRAIRDTRRRPRKYLAEQMEFGFVASLKRPAARALLKDETGKHFSL